MYGSTVRTNREFLVKWQLLGGDVRGIRKVQAAVRQEVEVDQLFQFSEHRLYTSELIAYAHSWPFFVQWNPRRMFHNYVLATNRIRRVVAPLQYLWDRNAGIFLY